ncbi:MAG: hypothetical protein M3360_10955 [Actinomycetota bacterium]|nr:hypothetical protein [Actinomycetota bacterium]
MTTRSAARLAWASWAALAALLASSNALAVANSSVADLDAQFLLSFDFLLVGGIGSLIAARRPSNAIGWLLIGIMLTMGVVFFSDSYAAYTLSTSPGSLPGGIWFAWVSEWLWAVTIFSFVTFLPLLYPDGKLPSPRWRPFAWAASAYLGFVIIVLAVEPKLGFDADIPGIRNPLAVEAMEGVARWVDGPGNILYLLFAIISAASLIQRYRRQTGAQRQQIKWFAFAMGLMTTYFVVTTALEVTVGGSPGDTLPGLIAAFAAILAVPAAIAIAILRYRLYDIDVIINRALVYGALTGVSVLVYLAGVFGTGAVVRGLTGQTRNDLVVAASTLAVAALFQPARVRIQKIIDLRFYRSKYDAEKTVEEFSTRLRDEIDIEALRSDLLSVVRDTMKPAHVSMWLRH